MKLVLCTEYHGLDPIRLLDYPLADVIDLMRQHLDFDRRKRQREAAQANNNHKSNAQEVVYRKADDSWF